MKCKLLNIIFFLTFVLTFQTFSTAQEQKSASSEQDEGPKFYEVTEVPTKIEEITNFIKKVEKSLGDVGDGKRFDSVFAQYKEDYKKLEEEVDLTNLETYFEAKLNNLRLRWDKLQQRVIDWQDAVRKPANDLKAEQNNLAKNIEIWKETYSNARAKKAPKELLTSINEINKSLRDLSGRVNSLLTLAIKIQNSLADENIKLTQIIENIDNAIIERRSLIFVQDVPPIWQMFSETEDTVQIDSHINEVWDIYRGSVNDFIDLIWSNLIYFILLFGLILLAVYGLRYFGKDLDTESHTVQHAMQLLNYPFSITVLTILIIFSFVYPDMPAVLSSLIRILALIPVIRILIGITDKILNLPLIGLAVLYILVQIQGAAPATTENERLMLFLLTMLALAGEYYLIKKEILIKAMENVKWGKTAIFGNSTAAVLIGISLLANMLGYITLSELLLMGTLNIVFVTILLATTILIINAIIFIQLEIKLTKIFNVVRQHPDKIKNTIRKVVRLGVAILWLSALLRSFQLRDLVLDWLTEALTKEWPVGEIKFNIGDILLGIAIIWGTVLLARLTRFLLEGEILPRLTLPRGVPGAISAIFSYSIIAFGIVLAIFAAGIDMNKFSLLAGGLGVGIGFGLQDLVKNFISGLILIFERPIQTGDAVQLDDLSGRVLRIGIRSSVITTWDGAEVIVPNGYLISSKLINWTMSNRTRRIDLKVGVAYDSNPDIVIETLMEVMKSHKEILENPKPYVLFQSFGDNAKLFEARCWTSNYGAWLDTMSELNVTIDKTFREKGIVIAFPQLDLHVKDMNVPENKGT